MERQEISGYIDPSVIGNDEYPALKVAIAYSFPGQTAYEPLRQKALVDIPEAED